MPLPPECMEKGHPSYGGGRPRTVSLPPEEMIKLGEEMVEYVVKNQKKMLHLCQWYSLEKMFTEKQWESMQQMPEFLPYYEKAIKLVGLNYLDKNSNVRDGISQRWQRVYFRDLKKAEDQDADENEARKARSMKSDAIDDALIKARVLEDVERNRKVPE